jgi:hypothetical protein
MFGTLHRSDYATEHVTFKQDNGGEELVDVATQHLPKLKILEVHGFINEFWSEIVTSETITRLLQLIQREKNSY